MTAPASPDELPGELPGEVPLKDRSRQEYPDEMEARASEWMSRAKHGDNQAFDELMRALRQRAFLTARSWVGSSEDALELSQEAFLKTYRARDTYRDGEPFLPWFHRILRNTCFSFLRQSKRLRQASLSSRSEEDEPDFEIEGEEPAPEAGVAGEEEKRAFWKGFARLSARDREILALRHFQELSYSEIARVLAIPEGTVMSRLFHARARLRTALAPLFPEEAGAPESEPSKPSREARR